MKQRHHERTLMGCSDTLGWEQAVMLLSVPGLLVCGESDSPSLGLL